MTTIEDIQTWKGQTLQDDDGNTIGEITDDYLIRESGEPEWLGIETGGLLGKSLSFVPLRAVSASGDDIRVAYDEALVKDAPAVADHEELTPEEARSLYRHYSLDSGEFADVDDAPPVGEYGSGASTDHAMTRSEEELRVGTTQVQTGRARLRKYVETEDVELTVPVQREEVRIEREPITDADVGAATDGPAISEEEHEVVLHAEEPVVEKRVVAQERVRLDTETVTEERQLSEEVRKEQIEVDVDR